MTSRLLTSRDIPELQPTVELRALADGAARYPFVATNRADAEAWQLVCRAVVAQTVGFLDSPRVDPAPELIEEVDRGDFIRRKIVITTAPHARMPVYLLIPKAGSQQRLPLPVAIAYAGHGYGVKDIVGLWEDGTERIEPDGYHKDFGVALCRRGSLVAAPEIAGFGERQTDYSTLDTRLGQPVPTTCHNPSSLTSGCMAKSPSHSTLSPGEMRTLFGL